MMELEHVLPADIEKTSFRIIEKELHEMGREIPEDKKHVILRVIHTTADFEYLDTMAFSEEVLQKASDSIRRGAHIVTDTTMAMSGINKRKLASFGILRIRMLRSRQRKPGRPVPLLLWTRRSARQKRQAVP